MKEDFVMWQHFLNFLKCPKIEEFYFRFIFCFKIDHVLIFEMSHFFMFEFFEMPHFSHFQNQIGKMGYFEKIGKMLSHDKILFHMLFGAFHNTPRIPISSLVYPHFTSICFIPSFYQDSKWIWTFLLLFLKLIFIWNKLFHFHPCIGGD